MGGKNAAIIYDDVELSKVVPAILNSCFLNQGEICLCTSRLFVHRSIYDDFIEILVQETRYALKQLVVFTLVLHLMQMNWIQEAQSGAVYRRSVYGSVDKFGSFGKSAEVRPYGPCWRRQRSLWRNGRWVLFDCAVSKSTVVVYVRMVATIIQRFDLKRRADPVLVVFLWVLYWKLITNKIFFSSVL